MEAELLNICEFGVLSYTRRSDITVVEWSRRVLTRIFTILKSDNVTVKSRQITGSLGRPQNPADYQKGENYAPTVGFFVCLAFMFMTIQMGWTIRSADVKSAFLQVELADRTTTKGERFRRILEVQPEMAKVFMEINERSGYKYFPEEMKLESDGRLYFIIEKAMYGLFESGR